MERGAFKLKRIGVRYVWEDAEGKQAGRERILGGSSSEKKGGVGINYLVYMYLLT